MCSLSLFYKLLISPLNYFWDRNEIYAWAKKVILSITGLMFMLQFMDVLGVHACAPVYRHALVGFILYI